MTRICGEAVARRLILGAELVGGAQAVALGLAHRSAPGSADLERVAREQVDRLAALPAPALAACKRCIFAAVDGLEDGYEIELEGSAALLAAADTQERVQRFLCRQNRSGADVSAPCRRKHAPDRGHAYPRRLGRGSRE